MSGPIATSVRLPDDSGNAGKYVRLQSKVVGGTTVQEHFYVQSRQAVLLGVYRLGLAQCTANQNADNGTTSGMLWFHVPIAISNKKARVRSVLYSTQHSTALATPTAPRMAASRFTFTGTASGATVTPVKVDSGWASPISDLRTANTGLTVTLVGVMGTMPYAGALTAVGAYTSPSSDLIDAKGGEDEWWVIAPGEGIVFWQDVAGTASDTRKMNHTITWDEIDTA